MLCSGSFPATRNYYVRLVSLRWSVFDSVTTIVTTRRVVFVFACDARRRNGLKTYQRIAFQQFLFFIFLISPSNSPVCRCCRSLETIRRRTRRKTNNYNMESLCNYASDDDDSTSPKREITVSPFRVFIVYFHKSVFCTIVIYMVYVAAYVLYAHI